MFLLLFSFMTFRILFCVYYVFAVDFPPMEAHPLLLEFVPDAPKSKLNFDEIFLINLERRPERRVRMEWAFRQFGLEHKLINAVDGK